MGAEGRRFESYHPDYGSVDTEMCFSNNELREVNTAVLRRAEIDTPMCGRPELTGDWGLK